MIRVTSSAAEYIDEMDKDIFAAIVEDEVYNVIMNSQMGLFTHLQKIMIVKANAYLNTLPLERRKYLRRLVRTTV
jgi:hypothetical protein